MKKLFIILFSLSCSLNTIAQEKYDINRFNYHDELMIQISLHNLITILKMSFGNFESLMAEDNYKMNSVSSPAYVWENKGKGIFLIGKGPGNCDFIWETDDLSVSQLKDDLEKYFSHNENGNAVYTMIIDDINYKIYLSNSSILIKKAF